MSLGDVIRRACGDL